MSDIKLVKLSKQFDGIEAVKDVSLTIEDGKLFTLLGPSGCGKTTTLRLIAGLENPSQGQVFLGEQDITNLPPYKRGCGMVFQNLALFPHLNIFDNIAYGMRVGRRKFTKSEIKTRVAEMLDLTKLPGFENRFPSQLSGGQQQRVAIARALAPDPKVLLLDEPLANLDRKLREHMQVELKRIQQKVEITTVFVTHDQEEAMTLSDKIAIMNAGKLIQLGNPTEVYEQPNSVFVADFIGEMNLFEGKIAEVNEEEVLIKTEDLKLSIDKEKNAGRRGMKVVIAVRPEEIQFAKKTDEYTVSGKVDLIRHLGDTIEYHIYSNKGKEIIVDRPRTSKPAFRIGETVYLTFPRKSCQLFAKRDERRVSEKIKLKEV